MQSNAKTSAPGLLVDYLLHDKLLNKRNSVLEEQKFILLCITIYLNIIIVIYNLQVPHVSTCVVHLQIYCKTCCVSRSLSYLTSPTIQPDIKITQSKKTKNTKPSKTLTEQETRSSTQKSPTAVI